MSYRPSESQPGPIYPSRNGDPFEGQHYFEPPVRPKLEPGMSFGEHAINMQHFGAAEAGHAALRNTVHLLIGSTKNNYGAPRPEAELIGESRVDNLHNRVQRLREQQQEFMDAQDEARAKEGLPPIDQDPAALSDTIIDAMNNGAFPRAVTIPGGRGMGSTSVAFLSGHIPKTAQTRELGLDDNAAPRFEYMRRSGGSSQLWLTNADQLPQGIPEASAPQAFTTETVNFPQAPVAAARETSQRWNEQLNKLDAALAPPPNPGELPPIGQS